MSVKTTNIFTAFLTLLTSKVGVVLVLLIFVGTPVISMSYSILNTTSQLIEEEHSQDDSEEDIDEDMEHILLSSNRILFVRKLIYITSMSVKLNVFISISFDIFLPPPKKD